MILQRLWLDALCDEKEGVRLVVHSKEAKTAQAGETGGLHSEQIGLGLWGTHCDGHQGLRTRGTNREP
jgi:hypothetical protein